MIPRAWPGFVLVAAVLGALLLTQAATYQDPAFLENWLLPLLAADAVIILVAGAALVAAVRRMWLGWKRGAVGSRLALRLAGMFLAMALAPALTLYAVSVNSIFRGIESWFETPLGRSFERGLDFGRDVLGGEYARLENLARDFSSDSRLRRGAFPFWVDDIRLLHNLDEIAIFDREGRLLAGAAAAGDLEPGILETLRELRLYRGLSGEGAEKTIAVALRLPQDGDAHALLLSRRLPENLAAGLAEIERGKQNYDRLLTLRTGLRVSFLVALTLAVMMTLVAAGWLSLILGQRWSRPLSRLASAAAAVGRGDLTARLRAEGSGEVANLNRAFNQMVADLERARRSASERQAAVTEANVYLENLLASLTAGILAFRRDGRLSKFNDGAARILGGEDLARLQGSPLSDWAELAPKQAEAAKMVSAMLESGESESRLSDGKRVLVFRARRLPRDAGGGALVVLDDITRQIRAEREAAWEEASQRFAHEIRNPLTPIQLSAERMGRRLAGKLSDEDSRVLEQGVRVITDQVGAMREMVDRFRHYAEGGRRRDLVDLGKLVRDMALMHPHVECASADGAPLTVNGDAVALRQILHNLLTNAAQAAGGPGRTGRPNGPGGSGRPNGPGGSGRPDGPGGPGRTGGVGARIRIWAERDLESETARIVVEDNGGGIPPELLPRVFDPHVSGKASGAGIGLAVARSIAEEHAGRLTLENIPGGARAVFILPTSGARAGGGAQQQEAR